MHSILAVDDSASMRQMVAFTLKNAGFNVVEAVEWAQRQFRFDESDRVAGHAPLPSQHSLLDIFGSAAARTQV